VDEADKKQTPCLGGGLSGKKVFGAKNMHISEEI
jgi:hypothetical protein